MKPTNYFLGAILILVFAACQKEQITEGFVPNPTKMSTSDLDEYIRSEMNRDQLFYWQKSPDEIIWNGAILSDSLVTIGYTVNGTKDLSQIMSNVDVQTEKWLETRKEISDLVLKYERLARHNDKLEMEKLLPFGWNDQFPQIQVQITSLDLIRQLRNHPNVRFVEPTGYILGDMFGERSGTGCDSAPSNLNTSDYTTIAPAAKRPWNFSTHNIPTAWNTSKGNNVKIAVIDTGASDNQDNLGSQFTSGQSGGRSISKHSTHYSGAWWWKTLDSPHDDCGHGTAMAGLAAGPRSNDGNSVGVAYKADLMTIRAVDDVVIWGSNDKNGVRDALYLAGGNSAVKIISMSIGTVFYSSTVADGIFYAYGNDKMMFSAAGTSTWYLNWYGVIFPASMSQTVAVTGVKDNTNNVKCNTCHTGSEVDFCVVMQRSNNNNRTSLSLVTYGNAARYISGSSCATATMAGSAALVWANNPSMNRSGIMSKLKSASQYYPNRDGSFGWGRVDVNSAL